MTVPFIHACLYSYEIIDTNTDHGIKSELFMQSTQISDAAIYKVICIRNAVSVSNVQRMDSVLQRMNMERMIESSNWRLSRCPMCPRTFA